MRILVVEDDRKGGHTTTAPNVAHRIVATSSLLWRVVDAACALLSVAPQVRT